MSKFNRDYLPHFRPSNTKKFMNCNLWLSLPFIEKTQKQIEYLQLRTDDHTRLAKQEYLSHEKLCKEFCEFIEKRCAKNIFRETKLTTTISGIEFSGTPDLFGWDSEEKILHVVDFKTGAMKVSAVENSQLLSYALLIIKNHPEWEINECILNILNTQSDKISQWDFVTKEKILSFEKELEKKVRLYKKNYTFSKGTGDWCNFCDAKIYCPFKRDGIKNFKEQMDLDTDRLIYVSRKRAEEIKTREQSLKDGHEYSELLSPLIKESYLYVWTSDDSVIPDKYWVRKKKMAISDARKQFPGECEQYLRKTKRLTLYINKELNG